MKEFIISKKDTINLTAMDLRAELEKAGFNSRLSIKRIDDFSTEDIIFTQESVPRIPKKLKLISAKKNEIKCVPKKINIQPGIFERQKKMYWPYSDSSDTSDSSCDLNEFRVTSSEWEERPSSVISDINDFARRLGIETVVEVHPNDEIEKNDLPEFHTESPAKEKDGLVKICFKKAISTILDRYNKNKS